MPKAYVIAHITVRDPARYAEYVRGDTPVVERFGGRFLVRGGPSETLEGGSKDRHVVIEFPDMKTARAFWASEDYQRVAAIRREAADGDLILVEGA